MQVHPLIRRILNLSFKGFILPITSFISFVVLLSFLLVLYKPSVGPSRIMRVGWQEWDQVIFSNTQSPVTGSPSNNSSGSGNDEDKTTDWWNVDEANSDLPGSSSIPLDIWLPLQPHDTGISEIAITRCLFDHAYGLCYPETTPQEDSIKGKWTRVERDVQAKTGVYFIGVYYRRTRRLDVPLITDLLLLGESDESLLPGSANEWHKVQRSIRDGVMGQPPLFLWYRLGPTMSELNSSDNLITEIDILDGDGRPFYGFDKLSTPIYQGRHGQSENVFLAYRRGVKPVPQAKPLHFHRSGHFKIMQIADLHFSVSHGICLETNLSPCNGGDDETLALMNRTLDLEKPDMVVFSGDQLNGQGTSWDPRSVLAKFAGPVIDRKIPWAAVLGNHDDESGPMMRAEQIKFMRAMPYSLVNVGPDDVYGFGNYVLSVRSPDASKTRLLTLYFIDSGSYSAGIWDWFGFIPTEYDYIRQSQTDWFLQESSLIPMHQRPWNPDGGKDLPGVWKRADQNKNRQTAERTLVKPNALMFYHIPIPETYSAADVDPASGKALEMGEQIDGPGNPKKNEGFFQKGLLKAMENELGGREVKVVANGHSHLTNRCRRLQGIWFCFNGGSSYSGYGKVGVDRRFRIFNITQWGEKIETYERTEHGEIVDQLVLVGAGGPTPYEGS